MIQTNTLRWLTLIALIMMAQLAYYAVEKDGIELQCDFKRTKVLIQFVTTANETLGEQYLPYRWGGEEFRLVCLE